MQDDTFDDDCASKDKIGSKFFTQKGEAETRHFGEHLATSKHHQLYFIWV
jgi:hypothetical protein